MIIQLVPDIITRAVKVDNMIDNRLIADMICFTHAVKGVKMIDI